MIPSQEKLYCSRNMNMSTKCLLCNSTNITRWKKINNFFLLRCNTCYIVFLWPQLKKRSIKVVNEKFYGSQPDCDKVFYQQRAKFFINKINKFKKKGSILDIGSGFGHNLAIAKKSGYMVQGIEISVGAARYSKSKYNLDIINHDFNSVEINSNSFDVITMYDVLEHMKNPNISLNKAHNILKKDGLLVIQCPNIDSIMAKVTRDRWVWFLLPYHLFHFSTKSIELLLKMNGFKTMKISTRDDWPEFIQNILWIAKIHRSGKLHLLFYPLYYLSWIIYPLSLLWSKLGNGGIINVYAKKI